MGLSRPVHLVDHVALDAVEFLRGDGDDIRVVVLSCQQCLTVVVP